MKCGILNSGVRFHQGFTLIELLVVISIIVVLVALAAPALKNVVQPTQLSAAGQMLNDQFNLARQESLTRNRQVEIRFYKLPATGLPGTEYRAVRLYLMDEYGKTAEALGKMVSLPPGIYIIDDSTHSCFSDLTASAAPEVIPGLGSFNYRYFRFQPNGSTNLDATQSAKWFWTLRNQMDAVVASQGLPANFVTLQIDPVTGRTRFFRP